MRCIFSRRAFNSSQSVAFQADTTAWRAVARVLRSTLFSAPGRALATSLHDLGAVLFPSPCRICSGPLLRVSLAPVCDACLARLHPQPTETCACCGESLGMESFVPAAARLCAACRLAPPPFQRFAAYGVYQHEMRRALHLLKYEGVTALARPLGALLAQALLTLAADAPPALTVVAVPLFPSKQRVRGYNQSILLAESALAVLRCVRPAWRLQPAWSALVRTRDTQSQFALPPHQRSQNLKSAFSVPDASLVRGRDLLLIDDICTTGATARECARVLLDAGAASVWVATLARAQMEQFAHWQPPPEVAAAS